MIRQYFPYTLSQRITSMPLFSLYDKLWLSFQLLCALSQVHTEGFYHGDIKPNNVALTSWNWLLLTDFAPYKPLYMPSANLGDYEFYFSREGKKYCYLAPEKLTASGLGASKVPLKAKQAMDIFSLGCVLAEVFLNGSALFDLPRLQAYKNGEYSPSEQLSAISFKPMQEMISDMIQVDPEKRKTIKDYLKTMSSIIPDAFAKFTYYFVAAMANPLLASSDRKVTAIFTHLDAIWNVCFEKDPPAIVQAVNETVFEVVRSVPFGAIVREINPKGFPYCVQYSEVSKTVTLEKPLSESMKYSYLLMVGN